MPKIIRQFQGTVKVWLESEPARGGRIVWTPWLRSLSSMASVEVDEVASIVAPTLNTFVVEVLMNLTINFDATTA